MADMEIAGKGWTLKAKLNAGEAPEMASVNGETFQPESVEIIFTQMAGTGAPSFKEAWVDDDGLAHGACPCHSECFYADEMQEAPQWLVNRVSEAQALVFRDAGAGGF